MNEKNFYKKHPIISNIISAVIGGVIIFFLTQWLIPCSKVYKNEIQTNGQYNTNYIFVNNSFFTSKGKRQMDSNNFKEIKSNEFGHVVMKNNNSATIEYEIPAGKELKIYTATSTPVYIKGERF